MSQNSDSYPEYMDHFFHIIAENTDEHANLNLILKDGGKNYCFRGANEMYRGYFRLAYSSYIVKYFHAK